MKFLMLIAFLGILASLASALFFMMRNGRDEKANQAKGSHMVRALAVRVGLSIVLFVCLLLAWKLGYIQPTGLPAGH